MPSPAAKRHFTDKLVKITTHLIQIRTQNGIVRPYYTTFKASVNHINKQHCLFGPFASSPQSLET